MPTEFIKCVTCGTSASESDFIPGTNRFVCSACHNLMRDLGDRVVAVRKHTKKIRSTRPVASDIDTAEEETIAEGEPGEPDSRGCLGTTLALLYALSLIAVLIFTSAPLIYASIATFVFIFAYVAFAYEPSVERGPNPVFSTFLIALIAGLLLGGYIFFGLGIIGIGWVDFVMGALVGFGAEWIATIIGIAINSENFA